MKRRTINILYIVNLSLALICALVPTLISHSLGYYEEMEFTLSLVYWVSFAFSILMVFAFIFYCLNRPRVISKVGYLICEISSLLFLLTPNICLFYRDGSYVVPLVINLVVLALFLSGILVTSTIYNLQRRD